MVEFQDSARHLLPDKYSLFFTLGTFLMAPELINRKSLENVWNLVQFGLSLDDCWDFGINRANLNGKPIDTNNFDAYLVPEIGNRMRQTRNDTRLSASQVPNTRERETLLTNLDRFESGIMLTENLALAIPYDEAHWPPELLDNYRTTDAMIWGAMLIALKSKTDMILPDLTSESASYLESPTTGLSRLYHHYKEHLLNSGREGQEALSLGWQMTFTQLIMDQDDQAVNKSYSGPSYYAFPFVSQAFKDVNAYRSFKKQQYLTWAKEYGKGKLSFTLPIAHLFQRVYGLITNTESWRSTIQGWNRVYTSTL